MEGCAQPINFMAPSWITKILDEMVREKLSYEKPMPFQAQILPIIMSGRDCLAIGKNWLMQNPNIYISAVKEGKCRTCAG